MAKEKDLEKPDLVINGLKMTAEMLWSVWPDLTPEHRKGVYIVLQTFMEGLDVLTSEAQAAVLRRASGRMN